ncbi:MAG: UDP-N-acetylmuramoylalanine--D-glutamate ligase, partial [Opitutaceae bacterium]|nr:UDP-N-acetylmuramoylalanine--D-glutamate ligase [Opitutaceae bacterium]
MALVIPELLREALARPTAVFGEGVSGQGVLALLRRLGLPGVCYDERGVAFTAERAAAHRLVVFSPGFAADHAWHRLARERGLLCLGEMDFAALFWKGRAIAITGTNGKTTLTEFLTHALRQEWEQAHAVGNIGRPLARLVADTAGGTKAD